MFNFWGAPRPLPIPCACGSTESENCPLAGLLNHRDFPPFRDLPDENDLNEDYYAQDEYGMYRASRHWVLVGEIVQVQFFIRPRATIRTKYGEDVLVNFHLDNDASQPKFFGWELLKTGNTMAILYANRRTFMDMNEGIRQENPGTVMVFKANLAQLTAETECYSHSIAKCCMCRSSEVSTKRCAKCKLATYCGRECQVKHWKAQHKHLCSEAAKLSWLARADLSVFQGYQDWSFSVEVLTEDQKRRQADIARHALIRNMTGTEPLSKPQRLTWLLDAVQSKPFPRLRMLDRSMLAQQLEATTKRQIQNDFGGDVQSLVLFQGLRELATKALDGDERSAIIHVLDMKTPRELTEPEGYEIARDFFIVEFFFSMVKWQIDEGILDLVFAVDTSEYFIHNEHFTGPLWDIDSDVNLFFGSLQGQAKAFMQ